MINRFFKINTTSTEKLLGIFNLGLALIAINDYYSETDSMDKERAIDILLHVLTSGIGLGLNSTQKYSLLFANKYRIVEICIRFSLNISSMSGLEHTLDIINHAINAICLGKNISREEEKASSEAHSTRNTLNK